MANYVDISEPLKQVVDKLRLDLNGDDWMLPVMTGDLSNPESFVEPFSTKNLNVAAAQAVSIPDAPGTATDTTIGPLQVDLLDSMRRAMLHRHCYPWSRCLVLARGADKAMADPQGPLTSYLDYVQSVLKQGRGEDRA